MSAAAAKKTTAKKTAAKKATPARRARAKAEAKIEQGMPAAADLAAEAAEEGASTAGMIAEVAAEQEPDIPAGALAVPLAGTTVHVKPVKKWFSGTHTALRTGDFDSWAETALIPGDFDIWCSLNEGNGPDGEQIDAMFEAWNKLTGVAAGKLPRSMNSYQRMAKR